MAPELCLHMSSGGAVNRKGPHLISLAVQDKERGLNTIPLFTNLTWAIAAYLPLPLCLDIFQYVKFSHTELVANSPILCAGVN